MWEHFGQERPLTNKNQFLSLVFNKPHCHGDSTHLQSQPKAVGTLKPYRATPFPPNQCWKISRFSNKKGKNHLIINIESGGRGELALCSNSFVRDCF